MNHKQLNFPFKRYQLQPVWRADRPQKGRYREFTQCDADVVGSNSLWNETELALIYDTVFKQLGLKEYTLKINHRKILAALAEKCGGFEKLTPISNAIDKLDKIGLEKVIELLGANLDATQVKLVGEYLQISGTNQEKLLKIEKLFLGNAGAKMGVNEIRHILSKANAANIEIDFTLARGLDYYTGIIFEAKAPEMVNMGSIGGGGRYDNLTGLFAVPDIPGVGISFGVDRIFDVMEELNLFPANIQQQIKALFLTWAKKKRKKLLKPHSFFVARALPANFIMNRPKWTSSLNMPKRNKFLTPLLLEAGSWKAETLLLKIFKKENNNCYL